MFSLSLADAADPVSAADIVQYTVSYQNLTGVQHNGVAVTATYDSRFILESAIPPPDAGTADRWTLGSLAAGQAGAIVIRGFFAVVEDGTPTLTRAEVRHLGGSAADAEATVVDTAPGLTGVRARLRQSALRRDTWRVSMQFSAASLDVANQEVDVLLIAPGGVDHTTPLNLTALELSPRGTFRFIGDVPGNGAVALRTRNRSGTSVWRVQVQARGTDILPPFPADTTFTVVLRIGSRVFVSESAELRATGADTRRFP
jgi:hypothetical protein